VEAEDVDSEEEVAQVMQGVARQYAKPLDQRFIVGVRRKVRGMRMYEGLKGALMNSVANIAGMGLGRGEGRVRLLKGDRTRSFFCNKSDTIGSGWGLFL